MEQYGNTSTYNLESVLVQNIKASRYYISKALDKDNVHEVIDEIYDTVDHVEPWLSGNARGPSSAFCLLFRLGELKPSPAEIREMLDHKDSPYIRAVGLLYLRFCCNPRDLWKWFRKYMRDGEEFNPSPEGYGKKVTIGDFARDILLDQYYFESIFPRIPKTVSDEIRAELRDMRLPTEALGNGGQGGPDRRGAGDGRGRPASVKASLSVAFGQRAPNRAGARDTGRGMERGEHRGRGRGGGGGGRGRSRSRSPGGGGGRDRYRDDRRGRSRSRSRDRWRRRSASRSRSRDRGGGYGYGRRDDYDRRDRDREYYDRRRRCRSRSRSRDRRRSRSRSRDRNGGGGGGGRSASDVFKERPIAPANANAMSRY